MGFLAGSFALIVMEALLHPAAAKSAEQGGGLLVAGLRRLLSGDVAGVPLKATRKVGKQLNKTGTTTPNPVLPRDTYTV